MNKIIKEDIDRIINRFPYEDYLANKTILITGASGLIAKYLTYFFLVLNAKKNTNIKILALVRNIEKAKQNFKNDENLIYINQDVCDELNYDGNVDYIFHAASSASATAIKTNPVGIIKANTIGTINILEFAKKHNTKKVIFPSTREVYGKVENIDQINESDMGTIDPMDSRNCYPESKRISEALFKSYYNQYGINFNILRIAHTYGPTMEILNDGRVMSDFIGAVVNNQNIVLNSDGTAIRSFCYVADTIEGILKVLIKGKSGEVYNLSNETEPYMIREVAEMLIKLFPEKELKLLFSNPTDEIKKGYVNYKIVRLNTKKIEDLGWTPSITLEEGLKRTVESFNK